MKTTLGLTNQELLDPERIREEKRKLGKAVADIRCDIELYKKTHGPEDTLRETIRDLAHAIAEKDQYIGELESDLDAITHRLSRLTHPDPEAKEYVWQYRGGNMSTGAFPNTLARARELAKPSDVFRVCRLVPVEEPST